jgi:hypothetical protein
VNQYMLSIIYPAGSEVPAPEVLQTIMKDVSALQQEMKAAGAWVFAAGLHPASTATVVRIKDGESLMTDGPYTETKEQVGGFSIVKAADLDAALVWAAKLARATMVPVEVRPLQSHAGSNG